MATGRECLPARMAQKVTVVGRQTSGGIQMPAQPKNARIQTTHIGSLPRPHDLLDIMKARLNNQPYDEGKYQALLTRSVTDCVRKQVECGIDFVTDGEFSKPGFFTYIQERLEGYEARPNQKMV